jgi:autotransporter adhesin
VIRNVAPGAIGAGSTEAVNGAQLHDTNQQVAQNATNVAGNTRAIETLKEGQSASSNQIANLSQGIEDGTVGLVRQEGGSSGNGRITLGGMTGGNSISLAGTSGNRKLSGVADGTAADDAVNVSQLAAAISTASMNDVRYDGADRGSVTFNAGGAPTGLRNVAAGRLDADSNDAVTGGQLHATNRQVASHTAQLALLETGQGGAFRANNSSALPVPNASGADAVAGGFGAVASGARSTAIGANAVASGVGSVALGHGSTDGGRDNVVSVGSEGAERQIANVAAGTRPTDAANLEQMNSAVGNALGSANAYTDHRIQAIGFDLANVRRDANAGTASAMAMAGLPQAFGEGGGMIGGAIGVYQNETAIALGASKVFNDGRTVVKGGATYVETSRGSTFGANVGIGYQF